MTATIPGTTYISRLPIPPLSSTPEVDVKDLAASKTIWKVLSCVPLIGLFSSEVNKFFLDGQIEDTTKAPRLVELIQLKNTYKVTDIVRNVFTVALLITGAVLGILTGTQAGIYIGCIVGSMVMHAFDIWGNQQIVQKLQSDGFFFPAFVK